MVSASATTIRPTAGTSTSLFWLLAGVVGAVGVAAALVGVLILFGLPSLDGLWWLLTLVPIAFGVIGAVSPTLAPFGAHALREASVVSVLAVLAFIVYLIVVIGLGRPIAASERSLLATSMVAAGIIALLVVPTRHRIAELTDWITRNARNAPEVVLQDFQTRMSRSVAMDELMLSLAESLKKNLSAQSVEIYTGLAGELGLTVSVPTRQAPRLSLAPRERAVIGSTRSGGERWAETWLPMLPQAESTIRIAPAAHQGELLGLLVVRRPSDVELTPDEDRVLVELARQLGLALNNLRLDSALQSSLDELQRRNDELRESRTRIVTASNETRRAIERNLHDGAQQHLVALAVTIGLVEQLLETDDVDGAKELLTELRGDVQETVREVRELAHGIYPPLLRDRGLPEALRAAATRSILAVTVKADGVTRHPPDLEAAVYFCCVEALQNAGKHAGADARVTVTVVESPRELRFTVADDGAGFAPHDGGPEAAGHGFTNMLDRVGALGGRLELESALGRGTVVSGIVPLERTDDGEVGT